MRLDIRYRCRFDYDAPVRESQNVLRACPASDAHQHLVSYRVATTPSSRATSHVDYWGTRVDMFGVRDEHTALEVVAEASVETIGRPLVTAAPPMSTLSDAAFVDGHVEYLERTPHASWGPRVEEAARRVVDGGGDVVGAVLAIHRFVAGTVDYERGATYVGVDVEDVLARRAGVCQDFAHLAVAMCRSVRIPARYVSGYLFTADDGPADDGGGDRVDAQTHAWFEAAVPGFGWIALDPTNRREVGLRHVKIGHGRDYDDVLPLRGVYSGQASSTMDVRVELRRVSTAQLQGQQ